jgi:hypothetical protein
MEDREQKIKSRAHAIWEEQGKPHGQHDEHWLQAERDVASAVGSNPGKLDTSPPKADAEPASAGPLTHEVPSAIGGNPGKLDTSAPEPVAVKPGNPGPPRHEVVSALDSNPGNIAATPAKSRTKKTNA